MKPSSGQDSKSDATSGGAATGKKRYGADAMRAVDSIVSSGVLGKGDRRANLLRYLVEMELSGRGEELKAFTIAMDVLGRDASFDPNTDSIVRSEVGRLRDALRLYYAEMAGSDELRIEIPKGTYRPLIPSGTESEVSGRRWLSKRTVTLGLATLALALSFAAYHTVFGSRPVEGIGSSTSRSDLPYDVVRIAVAPFQAAGSNPSVEKLAFGSYAELSMALAAYPSIAVVSPVHGVAEFDPDQVDYVLDGDVYWEDDTILTSARLVATREESQVWSDNQTLTAEPRELKSAILDIASRISFELGSMHGVAPELTKSKNVEKASENLEAFVCFLGIYQYLSLPTDREHLALRECLSTAVEDFPSFGDGWAALAQIYIDEARFGRNSRAGADPWGDAEHAIERGLRFSPLRMMTLNVALIRSIEAPEKNLAEFEKFATLLIRLYPSHPHTLYNVGSRMAEFAGDWDKGLALVHQAIRLIPEPPSAFYVTDAYLAAMRGSDAEALSSAKFLSTPTSDSQLLLNYLAAARNGLRGEMNDYRELLSQQRLRGNDDIIKHVLGRRYVSELEAALLEQLNYAFQIETAH